ncbi:MULTISPECIES: class GN sortase [unclassified Rhizobium]|uniref:class GN sortase n=1 Tax=unclassified Rhizobium TaxID=2613769 RepID=UPI000EA99FBE|nr:MULTISPECIES: class GN sortase [unclassified Rhizobium]AYG69955.1 class GN sortase [Rhizobium sp. CCGE531]AYG76331.1 class GN sortase [Rhizobium sp. CCGE532]
MIATARIQSIGSAPARSLLFLAAGILIATGLFLTAQGGWIYAKAALAQVLLERAFAESVTSGLPVKPWSWADTWPVARIEVPRLGVSAIALNGASGQALAFGPGHLDNTPEAGEEGTAVYAAHRDTHFTFLRNIKENDQIRITRRDGRIFTFRVTHMAVARWDEAEIDPDARGVHLVLATCFPFDAVTSGPLRYLVYADLEESAAPFQNRTTNAERRRFPARSGNERA